MNLQTISILILLHCASAAISPAASPPKLGTEEPENRRTASPSASSGRAPQPNFLIILADDCTHNDLPLYGGANARTPNIDALAAQGLTFNRAYLSEAMCQPCRAELYSGQFPLRNGCAWNHSASRAETTSIPQHLEPLGYRVGLTGKVHVKPDAAFPFENVPGFDPNCVREPTQAHDLAPAREFMARADSPFCLVIALVDPHIPWVMGDRSQYPPKKIKLPPNLGDTPRTREDYSAYLAEITYMDGQVGEILTVLEISGKKDNTLVLFTSEQGSQFPGNKWTNWDTGLHTALIARWPGPITPAKRTDAIVQYADILPTLLDLAAARPEPVKPGDPASANFDGTSFANVLQGKSDTHRQFAYGIHNNLPEGPAYPIRTVTDGRYRYIRNLLPDEIYIEKHVMGAGRLGNPYWATWVETAWENPQTYALVKRYTHRPAEQLYDTSTDNYELNDRATDPELAEIKARLSQELDRWMAAQGDPGIPEDTGDALEAARKLKHLY